MSFVPINLGVPTGTVMWYAGAEAPLGWLLCDGGTFSSIAYPVLADYLGETFGPSFNGNITLPDLTGKFIRGSGKETGRPFGSTQNDLFQEHFHDLPNKTHTHPVIDPGHIHDTDSATHFHSINPLASTHDHKQDETSGDHRHQSYFPSTGYSLILFKEDGKEVLYVGFAPCAATHTSRANCPVFPPQITAATERALANIMFTDYAQTGITATNIALTSVKFQRATVNIPVTEFSFTGLQIQGFGTLNTRPVNIALLPIIRT